MGNSLNVELTGKHVTFLTGSLAAAGYSAYDGQAAKVIGGFGSSMTDRGLSHRGGKLYVQFQDGREGTMYGMDVASLAPEDPGGAVASPGAIPAGPIVQAAAAARKVATFRSECGKEYTEEEYKQLGSEQESGWHKVCSDEKCECEVRPVSQAAGRARFKIELLSFDGNSYISLYDPATGNDVRKSVDNLTNSDIIDIIKRGIAGRTENPPTIGIY